MEEKAFAAWEKAYRAAAKKDHYKILRAHLERFKLEEHPLEMVESTVELVRACCGHYMVDGRSIESFLSKQTYDSQDAPDWSYSFTFLLGNDVHARVLLATKYATIDLVDLLDQRWENHTIGFDGFVASRNDGVDLSDKECAQIEEDVLNDFYFDYGEDELDVFFDSCTYPGNFHVYVHETL